MSTFDTATLLRDTTQELLIGMNANGLGSLADAVCTRVDRRSLSGRDPRRSSKDTAARDTGAQGVGASPRLREHTLTYDDYDMEQYDGGFGLNIQQMTDLDQYMDAIAEYTATERQTINTSIDADFAALLGAETQTKAATTAWDAGTTAVLDLQDGIKASLPEALIRPTEYVGVLGLQTAFDLNRMEAFQVKIANYTGAKASNPIDNQFLALRIALSEFTGIPAENWHIGSQFYDTNGAGLALSSSYLFGDFCWIGAKRAIRMKEQPNANKPAGVEFENRDFGLVTVKQEHTNFEVGLFRTLAMERVDDNLGLRFTGVGT